MRLALVLMGGGARAAYQVGALRALAQLAREVDPERRSSPLTVVCGTSAGAINAVSIASHADDFAHGVNLLVDFCESPTGSGRGSATRSATENPILNGVSNRTAR